MLLVQCGRQRGRLGLTVDGIGHRAGRHLRSAFFAVERPEPDHRIGRQRLDPVVERSNEALEKR